jgi:3-deoxy-D-arabino-heptulosonate 7-phosphate (DAHP) synthase
MKCPYYFLYIVEVHNNPDKALCDGKQAINIAEFKQLMDKLKNRYEFELIHKNVV